MFKRQRTGSVICTSCGVLVGVGDERCYNCNRWNPGLWGWAPAFRALGQDLGFVPFVIGTCIVVYALMLVFSRGTIVRELVGGAYFGKKDIKPGVSGLVENEAKASELAQAS